MKKILAFIITLILCIGLCACGKEDATQTGYPEGWDRIAEATKTLNRYYACETEEEYRAVFHSSVSQSNLKMVMDSMNEFRLMQEQSMGAYEQYVRKIKFVETHNGCDVFIVSDGFETSDGIRTPDQPLPEMKAPNYGMVSISGMAWSMVALVAENGQYVLPYAPETDWASYYATIVQCTCDLGTVVVPGDPCKSCNGEGCQTSADSENENSNICTTCGGSGHVVQSGDSDLKPCPDCSYMTEHSLITQNITVEINGDITSGLQMVEPCTDCEGTGLENYTYGDCPLCDGVGYTRNGN